MSNSLSSAIVWAKLRSYSRFWSIVFFVFALDQISKWVIFKTFPIYAEAYPTLPLTLIPNFLYIIHVHNTGAAWSLFSGYPQLLGIFGVVALAGIYLLRKPLELKTPSMQWVFGLLVGGILGNMTDRLKHGFVIDFIDVHLPHYHWPAFNFADCAISISIGIYILASFGVFKKSTR